ncbi:MAG: 3-deoxy-D-manno-octulosonic acid transferase [Pseudomonadota bacterium]
MTALLRGYGALSRVALPLLARRERRKLDTAGMGARFSEKLGQSAVARPEGKLLWIHAASVGESLSALALIERLRSRATILVTTGTATSAELMGRRLPEGAIHQFAALDAPGPVARFLGHWRPDAALFIESELWPNTIQALAARRVPLALANARMSEASLASWQKRPATARVLLQNFRLILTQTEPLAQALMALGAPLARRSENLKAMAAPLPSDPSLIAMVPPKSWVAASTHPGEEELVLNAHAMVLEQHPTATLLLAPRHPDRGDEVATLIAARGWDFGRRSAGDGPRGHVWLVDTLGELGSLYAAAPIVYLGGSLVKIGGHNPYEPAQAGAAILTGPHIDNFRAAFAAFDAKKAAQTVANVQTLASTVVNMLSHPPLLHIRREASRALATEQRDGLDEIERALTDALGL